MDERGSHVGRGRAGTTNSVSGSAVVHGGLLQVGTLNVEMPSRPKVPPRQLPPVPSMFVDRDEQRGGLHALAERAAGPGVVIASILGVAGVGKTALVSWWAQEVADRFPVQLYKDMNKARRDGAVHPGDILRHFLRGLGMAEELIPPTADERAAEFLSLTAVHRPLVVLDNVQQVAEVRWLLPAAGLVVVTSRRLLTGLITLLGAVPVDVGPLEADAGRELVRNWASVRPGIDDRMVGELVAACGGLPLLIGAVGKRLLEQLPASRGGLTVDRLVDEQLAGSGGSVEDREGPMLDDSYQSFSAATRRLYLALGVFPGREFTVEMVKAAGVEQAEDSVNELVNAFMAEAAGSERFVLHEVIHRHARMCAARYLRPPERKQVLRRVFDFYLSRTMVADREALGKAFRVSDPDGERAAAQHEEVFSDKAAALAWLRAEGDNFLPLLKAANEAAAEAEDDAAAREWRDAMWHLTDHLWAHFHSHKVYGDWTEAHRLAVEAARAEGQVDAQAVLLSRLARAYLEQGDLDRARAELAPSEELLGVVHHAVVRGVVQETRALLCEARGELAAAEEHFQEALRANEEAEDVHGAVVQRYQLARTVLRAGRPGEALEMLARAAAAAEQSDDAAMRPRISIVRGQALHALGRTDAALEALAQALRQADQLGQHAKSLQALGVLIEIAESAGRSELAAHCREQRAALERRLQGLDG